MSVETAGMLVGAAFGLVAFTTGYLLGKGAR